MSPRVALFVFLATLIASVGPTAAQTKAGEPKRGGQVIVGISQEPQQLNPVLYSLEVANGVQMAIFDNLWKVDEKGDFVPNLAVEIPTVANGGLSSDGRVYTIKIKQGVTWHDGAPFTSADVKFTWETIVNPKVQASSRIGFDQIQSFETPDPYTAKITLTKPYPPLVARLSETFIVPKHVLEKSADISRDPFNTRQPVGTGPFRLVEWRPGSLLVLEANRKYHGTGPFLDRVIFKIIPDTTVLFTQFKTGEIDVTGITGIQPDFYDEAKRLPDRTVHTWSSWFTERIEFNHMKSIFADRAVRKALSLAVDRKAIIDGVYGGIHSVSATYIPPTSRFFNPNVKADAFDPVRARALLDEAGWKVGSDGIRRKGDQRLEFTLSTSAGDRLREQTQVLIQEMWRNIGASTKIYNAAAAEIFGEYRSKSRFDLLMSGGATNVGPDPESSFRYHTKASPQHGGRGSNFAGFSSKAADELLDIGVSETDPVRRLAAYQQLQQELSDEVPAIQLYHKVLIEGTRRALVNYKPNANVRNNAWNVNEWWWNR